MDKGDKLYKGFISYSHADKTTAAKLLKRLQTYRLPKTLTHNDSRSLGQFFMDRDSLPAAESLSDAIMKGLSQSENLIVLCSPDAVASKWVNLEIETFRKVNPTGSVFAVILSGDPAVPIEPDASFPAAIRDGGNEPLAADFRREADGPKLGFLKLAAALSDTRLEDLLRRDQTRTRRRVTAITVAAGAVALSMSLLAATAISARQEAEARQADAEGLVDFMLTDLRDELEPIGRLDVLDGVAQEALDYYDAFDEISLECEQVIRKARALHLDSQIKLSKSQLELAEQAGRSALNLSDPKRDACADVPEFYIVNGHSAYFVGHSFWVRGLTEKRRGDVEAANEFFQQAYSAYEQYQSEIENLKRYSGFEEVYAQEAADNHSNFGAVKFHLGEYSQAKRHFEQVRELLKDIARLDEPLNTSSVSKIRRNAIHRLSDSYGWIASIDELNEDYSAAIANRKLGLGLQQRLLDAESGNIDDWNEYVGVLSRRLAIAKLYLKSGDRSEARKEIISLSIETDKLVKIDPENVDWENFHQTVEELKFRIVGD